MPRDIKKAVNTYKKLIIVAKECNTARDNYRRVVSKIAGVSELLDWSISELDKYVLLGKEYANRHKRTNTLYVLWK